MKSLLKFLLYLILINGFYISQAQTNGGDQASQSVIYTKLTDQYDYVLAYNATSYWSTTRYYFILACKENKWSAFRWEMEGSSDNDSTDEKVKIKTKKISISNAEANELMDYLAVHNLWEMNEDSLNCRTIKLTDSSRIVMMRTDGVSEKFEVFTKGKYKRISVYEAEYFQEKIPVKQREEFIACRKRFYKVMKLQ